jgi:replicative DNA helicase
MSIIDFNAFHKGGQGHVPHNIELEQAILGALLLNNDAYDTLHSVIDQNAFFDPVHGALYALIVSMIERQHPASPITLKPAVMTWPPIADGVHVWQYLGRLVAEAAGRAQLRDYAQELADMAARRRLIGLAQDVVAWVHEAETETSASTLIERAEKALFEITAKRTEGREISIADAVEEALASIAEAYDRGGALAGIPTKLVDLDAMLGGLQPSDLIILGGRPSMGKSALAMTIAYNVARESVDASGEVTPGQHVHVFSLEMSARQIAMRLMSERAEIASDAMRRGKISEADFRQVMTRSRDVASSAMTIDETGGISLASLAAKARRIKRKHDTKLIVVDYLQLMSGASRSSDNRVQEITKLTMGLKALAKELDVPIIALSQLSRKVEERSDKRPQLSDLRESGSIEQDADVVMFVYRDEYYLERERPDEADVGRFQEWQERMQRAYGKAEVVLSKSRHGPVGIVNLAFHNKFTRFANLAPEGRNV